MEIRSITKVKNLKGKRVLLRADFNAPITGGRVLDEFRIKKGAATIKYLLKKGARVIIISHRGRPKEGVDKNLSLRPIKKSLEEFLRREVALLPIGNNARWAKVIKQVNKLKDGQCVMLENIRFLPNEETDTGWLAKALASLADLFVLDGFAVAHRSSASVSGVAKYLPSYAGLLLAEEINGLSKAIEKPAHPLVVILGGAKAETKIPVLKHLLPKADYVLIGGGIMKTFMWVKGLPVGGSLIEKNLKKEVLRYGRSKKIILPIDVVVGRRDGNEAALMPVDKQFAIQSKYLGIYDIGPATAQLFSKYIKKARTLIFNGAMGMFEVHPYEYGTKAITEIFAARAKGQAFGVCGGGETVQVLQKMGLAGQVDLVSTGGGAMLEFLSGKKLPGVEAVRKK